MQAFAGASWQALAGLALAGVIIGWFLRHRWGAHVERAHAERISSLCDQLDAKDGKLHGLRAELLAEKSRVFVLQSGLDVSFPARALVPVMVAVDSRPEPADHTSGAISATSVRLKLTGSTQ